MVSRETIKYLVTLKIGNKKEEELVKYELQMKKNQVSGKIGQCDIMI